LGAKQALRLLGVVLVDTPNKSRPEPLGIVCFGLRSLANFDPCQVLITFGNVPVLCVDAANEHIAAKVRQQEGREAIA